MNSVKSQLLQKPEGIKFERQKQTIKCIYSLGAKIRGSMLHLKKTKTSTS